MMHPTIDGQPYLSANLEIGADVYGKIYASLSWPQFDFHSQDEIDLRSLLDQIPSYNTALDFLAHSLPHADEQAKKLYVIKKELSNLIWDTVFNGNLTSLMEALADYAHHRPILLHVDAKGMPFETIPWELLGNPESYAIKEKELSLNVCRVTEPSTEWLPQKGEQIRIFLAQSQPIVERAIHIEEEFGAIRDLFVSNEKVYLPHFDNMDYFSFCQNLELNPHIVHLACHGESDTAIFKRGEDRDPVPYQDLADTICSFKSIGLVVLNVCNSSKLARLLVEKGVPAAIGMSTDVSDFTAKEFSRWFYLNLKRERTVCQAFYSAVRNVRNSSKPDHHLWSGFMLYENQEITPFIDFLNTLRIDLIPPTWNKKEVLEIISRIQEFIHIFERLKPDSRWTAYHWERETSRILLLQMGLKEAIKALSSSLPETYNLEAQDIILGIRRAQAGALQLHQDFDESIPNWAAIDTDPESKTEIVTHFMNSGMAFVTSLKNLNNKLRSAVGVP